MKSMILKGLRCRALGARIAIAAFVVATGTGTSVVAAPEGGKDGGTMVVALPGDPPVINSTITTDISSSNISGQVYSTIVRLDRDGKVLPYLAKSWEISPDGLTYTFHLYEGIKWHDGTPFTGEDIAWSLINVNKKYNGPASGLLAPVESITAPDPNTVVFKLKYPSPPLLRGLAYFNSSTIVPKHLFDNGQDPRNNPANMKPVGTRTSISRACPISIAWSSRSSRTRGRGRSRWRRATSISSPITRCRSARPRPCARTTRWS